MRAFAAVRRVVLTLAAVGVAASTVFAYALLRDGTSASATVVIVIALLPAVILLALWYLLGELRALPARIRELFGSSHGCGTTCRSTHRSCRC